MKKCHDFCIALAGVPTFLTNYSIPGGITKPTICTFLHVHRFRSFAFPSDKYTQTPFIFRPQHFCLHQCSPTRKTKASRALSPSLFVIAISIASCLVMVCIAFHARNAERRNLQDGAVGTCRLELWNLYRDPRYTHVYRIQRQCYRDDEDFAEKIGGEGWYRKDGGLVSWKCRYIYEMDGKLFIQKAVNLFSNS